jgi:hypothetical protein
VCNLISVIFASDKPLSVGSQPLKHSREGFLVVSKSNYNALRKAFLRKGCVVSH